MFVKSLINFVWDGSNLDHILVEGDILYKSFNTIDLLNVNELQRSPQLHHFSVLVIFESQKP